MHRSVAFPLLLALTAGACGRAPRAHVRQAVATDSTATAIARDQPEHRLAPLAGAFTLERVAVARARLDHAPPLAQVEVQPAAPSPAPPAAEPGEPPAPESRAATTGDERVLQPPIPRGAPASVAAGRGGRVTLDVRVDEQGDVSDALLVESDADSLAVHAAMEAASAIRYHPALLGGTPTAVWTRQVFMVQRAGMHARR